MSGHSKWSTIKRQKGVADAKRGQVFTKLSNAITLAVKQGGGISDTDSNFKLRLAIDKARSANMPKENIERAIQKAKGSDAGNVDELVYEGFAPGGVAVIVETVTDNKMRTVSEVKNILEKNGGTLGNQGSVSYLFTKRGQIIVKKNNASSDELLNKGIEAGVEDMEEEDDVVFFYVDPISLAQVKTALENAGVSIETAEIVYVPNTYMNLEPAEQERVYLILDKLNESDDVQQVYTNLG